MKPSYLNAFCFLFLVICQVEAADFTQSIVMKDKFTVRLPANWRQIPKSVLEKHKAEMQSTYPNVKIPDYTYAFQKNNKQGEYFKFPYIIITMVNAPMTKKDIEKFTNYNIDDKKIKSKLPNDFSKIEFGKYIYDSDGHILWMNSKSNVAGLNLVGVTALKRTKVSTIIINCSCLENEYGKYSQFFEDFIRLIKLDDSIKGIID